MKRAGDPSAEQSEAKRKEVQEPEHQSESDLRSEQVTALVLPYTASTALLALNRNLNQLRIEQGLPLQLAWSCVSTDNLLFCIDWHLERRLVCEVAAYQHNLALLLHARAQGYPWGDFPELLKPHQRNQTLYQGVDYRAWWSSKPTQPAKLPPGYWLSIAATRWPDSPFIMAASAGRLALLEATTIESRAAELKKLEYYDIGCWLVRLDAPTLTWFLRQDDLIALLREHLIIDDPPHYWLCRLLPKREWAAQARVLLEAGLLTRDTHCPFPLAWIAGRFDRLKECINRHGLRLDKWTVGRFAQCGWLQLLRELLDFLDDCIENRDTSWFASWFDQSQPDDESDDDAALADAPTPYGGAALADAPTPYGGAALERMAEARNVWLKAIRESAEGHGDDEMLRWARRTSEAPAHPSREHKPESDSRAEQALALVLPYTASTALLALSWNLNQVRIQQGLPLQLAWSCVAQNNLAYCVDWHLDRRLVCQIAVHNRDLALLQHAHAQGYPWGDLHGQNADPLLVWARNQGWQAPQPAAHAPPALEPSLKLVVAALRSAETRAAIADTLALQEAKFIEWEARHRPQLGTGSLVAMALAGRIDLLEATTPESRAPELEELEHDDCDWLELLDAPTLAWVLRQKDLYKLLLDRLTNEPPHWRLDKLLGSCQWVAQARALLEAGFLWRDSHCEFPLAWIDGRFDRLEECVNRHNLRLDKWTVEKFAERGWLQLLRELLAFLENGNYRWWNDWFNRSQHGDFKEGLFVARKVWLELISKAATAQGDAEMLRWTTEKAEI